MSKALTFDPIYIYLIQSSYSFTFCKIDSAILPDDAGGFSESMFLSEVSHNVDVESVRSWQQLVSVFTGFSSILLFLGGFFIFGLFWYMLTGGTTLWARGLKSPPPLLWMTPSGRRGCCVHICYVMQSFRMNNLHKLHLGENITVWKNWSGKTDLFSNF